MNGERENRIDLLRGLSLLLIFIGHAEFTFSPTFQQSRGFSDASEVFVLLAGMSCALAYYRPYASLQLERPWKRALRLYFVHLILFAVMVTISAFVIATFDQTAWPAEMTDFLARSAPTWSSGPVAELYAWQSRHPADVRHSAVDRSFRVSAA